jgi:hypothetical protein
MRAQTLPVLNIHTHEINDDRNTEVIPCSTFILEKLTVAQVANNYVFLMKLWSPLTWDFGFSWRPLWRWLSSDDGGSKRLWNVGLFLWDYTSQCPRTRCRVHKSAPVAHKRNQLSSAHTRINLFFKMHFNIIPSSMPTCSKWYHFLFGFSD